MENLDKQSQTEQQGVRAVPAELDEAPLGKVVHALFEVSWGKGREWIRTGKVFVDGQLASDQSVVLAEGQQVELRMNAPRVNRPPALRDEDVRHVDDHVIVVNKPSGVMTIPYEEEEGTLDELVRNYLRGWERRERGSHPAGRAKLGIVHRIDIDTTGLLVFTRSWAAKESLSRQFREHTVKRCYLAIVHGAIESQTIRSRLIRDRGDGFRGSLEAMRKKKLKRVGLIRPSVTHVEALEPLRDATFVACRLETGRTHQIRIHLGEAGHPLVGERVYMRGYQGKVVPAPRIMLHAAELGFRHPVTGKDMAWEQPMPEDMQRVLQRLRGTK